jgi:hypothetical protein
MMCGESTSRKSLDFEVWSLDMVQRCGENTYEQGESRRGEERRGKEMDGCPLTDRCPLILPPLQSAAS